MLECIAIPEHERVAVAPQTDVPVIVPEPSLITINNSGGGSSGTTSAVSRDFTADSTLSGHRAVIKTSTGVAYADNTDETHSGRVIGLTGNAANTGGTVTVVTEGVLDGFTGLVTGQPVYLGVTGLVTQTLPATGFIQQVGVAISATMLYVSIHTPIHLI